VSNLIAVDQMVRAYGWRSDGKTGPLRSAFQCHALKVIGTDTDRSGNCDFLLTFYRNHGLMLYSFKDIARYWLKIAIF